ncbi:MAG: class C sortase [Atopobiaceae bacterium]
MKRKRNKKVLIAEIVLGCLLLAGIGMMLYPTISDWWNKQHQSEAIATYQQAVSDNSAEKNQEMWDEAVAYNATLQPGTSRFTLTEDELAQYESLLNVTGTGIMGYVKIPKINVELPVYHGTDDATLQIGVGHIPGSSLPVGGLGTHTVISGHRGLPSARLFTDIDQLEEGDLFEIDVLGKTLTYQVDQIRTVLPDELQDLEIDPNMDLATLVTCTPYGVNTHRLLVRGHRVDTQQLAAIDGNATKIDPVVSALVLTVAVALVFFVVRLVRQRRSQNAMNALSGKDGTDAKR